MQLTHPSDLVRMLFQLMISVAAVVLILEPAPAPRGFQTPAKSGQPAGQSHYNFNQKMLLHGESLTGADARRQAPREKRLPAASTLTLP